MKAVGYTQSLPSSDPRSLEDLQLPAPAAADLTGRDLLVRVLAVSVNPVDTKVRKNRAPQPGQPEVLGYDAVGIVEATAPGTSLFRPGDRVWYAGSITRSGTNAELHVVDERIVGPAPTSLSDAQAYPAPVVLELADFNQVQASVFQVARAPGKNVVYLGCALLILGVFAMLYVRDRRLWVWLAPQGGGAQATMAMSSNRKALDNGREFAQLTTHILGTPVDGGSPR